MPLPIVAVVGRPNVGKSTFVNRIAQADEAIVHEMRGVTRDRSYHEADWNGVHFTLVDTGGIEMGDDDAFQGSIRAQAFEATREADVIVFLVDGRTGINADDEEVARILRKADKPVFLVVNKLDTPNKYDEMWEFYQLGLGDPWPVSSMHGHGTGDLLDEVVARLQELDVPQELDDEPSVNVAIIGRPNAGKSSLTNKMTSGERSIVSDVAGTTRDAIDTPVVHDGKRYTIVDTAGLRRKSQIDEDVEYYGFVRAMRAIDRADVALLVVDSTLGLTDQDQRVAGYAAERGCAMVIVLNKWDLVEGPEAKADIRERIADRMTFVGCLFVTFGWVGACLELLIFAVLVVATKHVSVGSIAAAATCPFFALYFFWGDWLAWACCTIAALTVVWAHRGNIARLRAGTESRIGQKKEA